MELCHNGRSAGSAGFSLFVSPPSKCSSSASLRFPIPRLHTHSWNSFRLLKFGLHCSLQTIQLDTQQINPKKKRKPRPSFLDQIHEKWSVRTSSLEEKFPWQQVQEQEKGPTEEVAEQGQQMAGAVVSGIEIDDYPALSNPVSSITENRVKLAPWIHGSQPRKTHSCSQPGCPEKSGDNVDGSHGLSKSEFCSDIGGLKNSDGVLNYNGNCDRETGIGIGIESIDTTQVSLPVGKGTSKIDLNKFAPSDEKTSSINQETSNVKWPSSNFQLTRLPWERVNNTKVVESWERPKNGNSKLADKLIPEPELKRLRNVALRMLERIKVKAAGVTQALVDSIHEKWKHDEVVKLKFEGPPAMNMKRTHELLESGTGGLVIWRSGNSVVLYRGIAYKLDCVQSYASQNESNMSTSEPLENQVYDMAEGDELKCLTTNTAEASTDSTRLPKKLSEKEVMDLNELNSLLDELGPRFNDWSGRDPVPVDADLLPPVIPGYKPPFRLLPYRVRQGLRDKHMTFFRRTARTMPPHFALGRNRELQGLAMAMVKLWERSAIAKIAIKRGVQNTCNDRMSEELKKLTGGTLLSRNKDYIVFYRGNDFLPSSVTEALVEAQKLAASRQDDEELARQKASAMVDSSANSPNSSLVAGTLSETMAAISRWTNQPSSEEMEKMLIDVALSRHASLVRYLEKKLVIAKGKIKKAENALMKVQEHMEPAELPTDLETLSDEERILFRRIGLSMKPFLPLGIRGVYGGVIENMHLHWKYRELVKIIVKGRSFPQVKHIATFLEAESGGVLVSIDNTSKGYAIIVYRGKNYQRPYSIKPKNLLSKRQALARSIELQRREALKHHIVKLQEKIEKLKIDLEDMKTVTEIDEHTLYTRLDDASDDDEFTEEDEDDGEDGDGRHIELYDRDNELG